ncbi:MGH1-like glycoside hydrolase domain-containing protein [Schumannella soli]|uniref:MGH1-like glycoside hydrolase domain-containing protein n=1 Tax=Schumannella soli TaxID=2590779 RepID=UPI001C63D723|nr:discoidin domain-containing protein [Schumannella soli]
MTASVLSALPALAHDQSSASDSGPYPAVGAGTSFLDHQQKLAGLPDPAWFEANIPFVDLPDADIESTYYYRWRTYKEALKYTGPENGWIVTEFLGPVGYAAPGGAISAAAGHHIYEGRWLRDQRYVDDYLDYWLTGPGAGAKPATDGLGSDTTDWAHQYSFWVADAVLAKAEVDGRVDEATARLGTLEKQWQGWSPQYDKATGLYWQTPVWDAMEYTASSYQSDDPYHGGAGYRPTLNAYQYGDAQAIAKLADLSGDRRTAKQYRDAAAALQKAQDKYLWDAQSGFYKHVMRDDNPQRTKIADREEIGFIPWAFDMAPKDAAHTAAWAQLTDEQGFTAAYGPTTVERRSPLFMKDAELGCCRWSGPSWPYATSQTATALGNLLADYPKQKVVTSQDLVDLMHGYALTQRKDGKPYVAEAHHPDEDRWLYDGTGHSEDYNHSTYTDLVLGSLLGIRGQTGDSVRIDPQVGGWDHFAAENVPYHGRNLTVVWDRDGSHYAAGKGLSVWLDGKKVLSQKKLGDVTVRVPAKGARAQLAPEADDLAAPDGRAYPVATASYSWRDDSPAEAIDGQDFQLDVPGTRWTTYGSPNASDWLQVDLGTATTVRDVRTTFYDDGGGVKVPASYRVEYRKSDGSWAAVPGAPTPATPVGGALNRIQLTTPVTTDALRLVGTPQSGAAFGVTSFGAWRPVDASIRASIATAADGSIAVTAATPTTVTTTLKITSRDSTVASDKLVAPVGWKVERLDRGVTKPRPGTYTSKWKVTPPADLAIGADAPLRYAVDSTRRGFTADTVVVARAAFDPAAFPTTAWNDDFSTDELARYGLQGQLGEPAPTATVDTAAGTLVVTSTGGRDRGLFTVPVAAGAQSAVVMTPKSFAAGDGGENSLFLGLTNGPDDIAMSWYNHRGQSSGVNVVVGGQGRGDAEGGGSSAVTWQPGDRLATVVSNGRLSSWIEHAGTWTRLRSAPVSVAIPADQLAAWHPAFALRLDPGTITLDRVQVLTS